MLRINFTKKSRDLELKSGGKELKMTLLLGERVEGAPLVDREVMDVMLKELLVELLV